MIEDKEIPGELEAFRDEIRKLAEINESLRLGVKNIGDLKEDEAIVWRTYKHLFREAYKDLDQCQNLQDIRSKRKKFIVCLRSLDKLTQLISSIKDGLINSGEVEEKNKSRIQFLAWVDNLLVLKSNLFSLIHDLDSLDENDLVKIKNSMQVKKDSLLL